MKSENALVHKMDKVSFDSNTIIQFYDKGWRFGKFIRANKSYAWVLVAGKEIKIPLSDVELYLPKNN